MVMVLWLLRSLCTVVLIVFLNGSVLRDGCAEGLKSVRCFASGMIHSGIEFTGLFLTNTIPTNGWPQTSIGRWSDIKTPAYREIVHDWSEQTINHPSELSVEVSPETTQQPNLYLFIYWQRTLTLESIPPKSLPYPNLLSTTFIYLFQSKTHSSLINRHHHHALLRWISTKGWIEKEAHHFQYDQW